MLHKAKGQRNPVAKPGTLALAYSCGPVPQRIEEPITNRLVLGWNPSRSARLLSPACSANCLRGLASGLRQRQGCLDSLSFWTHLLEESKVQNDVPLVQSEGGQGRSPQEWGSAVEVPAV